MYKVPLSAFNQHNLVNDEALKLSDIYTLAEYKLSDGKPIDGKVNLDWIFNSIIDNVANANINLHIGRRLIIDADIVAKNNKALIAALFDNIDDNIAYEQLAAADVSDISGNITATLSALIQDIVINSVTDNADTVANLCVTRDVLPMLSSYIYKYANKVFRNLNQLIRVKRDWRLYGPGATISGNYLTDAEVAQIHTTVPAECFKKYSNGYVAGNTPYYEQTAIGAIVQHSKNNISPATVFTPAAHTHKITNTAADIDTAVSGEIGPYAKKHNTTNYTDGNWFSDVIPYELAKSAGRVGSDPNDFTQKPNTDRIIGPGTNDGTKQAKVGISATVQYGSGTKYLQPAGTTSTTAHVPLPAYAVHMWQWQKDDTTQL